VREGEQSEEREGGERAGVEFGEVPAESVRDRKKCKCERETERMQEIMKQFFLICF